MSLLSLVYGLELTTYGNEMNQMDNNAITLSPQVRTSLIILIAIFAAGAMAGMGLLMFRMVIAVENMSTDVHEMTAYMQNMNRNIDEMDNNILMMNKNIFIIQKAISQDIDAMAKNMQSMNSSILIIRDDIHYSAGSFSSPSRYMRNMFDSPR